MEGPPLWIWAIVAAAVVASKFLLRWSRLKRLARTARNR
jgi:hypothetical protein